MPSLELVADILGWSVIGAPTLLLLFLGLALLVGYKVSELVVIRSIQAAVIFGLLASLGMLAFMLLLGPRHVSIQLGEWVHIPHYHFSAKIVFDRLSIPFVILSFALCGTIGAFGSRYMHREGGFNRFFVLYALFMLGMVVASLAGTIETLFAGWEMVGLASALLVAFFQDRPAPSRNGLHVWIVYRVSDAALLLAAVVLHHMTGEGDFTKLMGDGPWPAGHASLSEGQALVVGFLLIIAAAGKSALVPFSGWLPRAMEGPTPSSAVFYGALSVHLGAFLLLRVSPIVEASLYLSSTVVVLGLLTALFAYLSGSVQTDIKSALSFASLSQVGIIVAEIGLGFRYLALVHLLGHACLRTLQFVRAPTLLQDYHTLENAIGARLPHAAHPWERLTTPRLRTWLYRFALERGYLDAFLANCVARPFLALFGWFDSLERRWTTFLSGQSPRAASPAAPNAGRIEELP